MAGLSRQQHPVCAGMDDGLVHGNRPVLLVAGRRACNVARAEGDDAGTRGGDRQRNPQAVGTDLVDSQNEPWKPDFTTS